MKHLLFLLVLANASCSKGELLNCEGQQYMVVNHTTKTIQLSDDQGNPLQPVKGLGKAFPNTNAVYVNGTRYDAEPCTCGCEVIHIH